MTIVAQEFGINKSAFLRACKTFQTNVRKFEGGRVRKTAQWMTDISSCKGKEIDTSKWTTLLSSCVRQRDCKCRILFWPDAFFYSSLFASYPERCIPFSYPSAASFGFFVRNTKIGHLINTATSSLQMRVLSVSKPILNPSKYGNRILPH